MSMKDRLSRGTYKHVMHRSKGRCEWCGSKHKCGIDHKMPRTLGGGNHRRNLQLLCERCGSWKSGYAPEEVVQRIKRLRGNTWWHKKIREVALPAMQAFIEELRRLQAVVNEEDSKSIDRVIEDAAAFDNPLHIVLGEGKVQLQFAEMESGGAGIVFQLGGRTGDVGEKSDESILGFAPRKGQVVLQCKSHAAAKVLRALAAQVEMSFGVPESINHMPLIGEQGDDNHVSGHLSE